MVNESSTSALDRENRDLMADLERALDADQFLLVYQPTIDLRTNGFAGVEALLRWRHPSRGIVNPDAFVPELERSGLIVPVGRWALLTACAQGALWHAKGYRFSVSVNISVKQFERPEFVDDVAEALVSSRFDPALLTLEFAQHTLLDRIDDAQRHVAALSTMGVRIAVDDFAFGESDLADLERFAIDVVKISRVSVENVSDWDSAALKVHELVDDAQARGIQVVASGIEDDEQRRRLQIEQVALGQGFHFSRPHEASVIDRYLEDFALFSGKPL